MGTHGDSHPSIHPASLTAVISLPAHLVLHHPHLQRAHSNCWQAPAPATPASSQRLAQHSQPVPSFLIIGFKNEKGCLRAPMHQQQCGKIPAELKIVLCQQPPTEAPLRLHFHPMAPLHWEVIKQENTHFAPTNEEPNNVHIQQQKQYLRHQCRKKSGVSNSAHGRWLGTRRSLMSPPSYASQ